MKSNLNNFYGSESTYNEFNSNNFKNSIEVKNYILLACFINLNN